MKENYIYHYIIYMSMMYMYVYLKIFEAEFN